MRILKLDIRGFGKFHKPFSIRFDGADDINLIVGPNEAGKSTIASAISGVLFGFKKVDDVQKFAPWQTSDYWAALTVESNGSAYRVERDFSAQEVRCVKIDAADGGEAVIFVGNVSPRGKLTDEKERYATFLAQLFGFSEYGIFRSTIFVGQSDIAMLGEDELAGKIKQFVTGSTETDYSDVQSDLEDQYFRLTKSNPWGRDKTKNRQIETIEDDIKDLSERVLSSRANLELSRRIERDIEELETALAEKRDELAATDDVLKRVGEFRDIEHELNHLREMYADYESELNTITAMRRRLVALEDEYSDLEYMEHVPEDFYGALRELESIADSIKTKDEKIAAEKKLLAKVPGSKVPIALIGAVLCLGLALVIGHQVKDLMWLRVLVYLAGAAGLVTPLIFAFKRESEIRKAKNKYDVKIDLMKDEIELGEKRRGEIVAQLDTVVKEGQIKDYDGLRKRYDEFQKLKQKKRETALVLEKLSDETALREKFSRTKEERFVTEEAYKKAIANAGYLESITPDDEEKNRRRAEVLRREIKEGEERALEQNKELWSRGQIDENVAALDDRLEELDVDRARLVKRRDATLASIEILRDVIDRYNESYLERLAEGISDSFGRITAGKYAGVTLDEDSLEPAVSDAANAKIALTNLSAGTQDQLYFAIRLALMRYLTNDRELPLILDDPFSAFDAGRLGVTRDILIEVAKTNQVIMFTHDTRYAEWRTPVYSFTE